jgi:hypothetical protein
MLCPVLVNIHRSTWGGSVLKERYNGRAIHPGREDRVE